MTRYVVVVSLADPVGRAVHDRLGARPSTGAFVDGAAIRQLTPDALVVGRSTLHIHDDGLESRLPPALVASSPTLVFPSIHRSESGAPCFTVHPLGNLGGAAEVGGAPHTLVPAAPRLMTDALRRLHEGGERAGLSATFEATHHGPVSALPAFFAEIGYGSMPAPPESAVRVLADILLELSEDPTDHVVVGVGGGHYAPHFSDLAVKRRWAFGHLVSRHALLTTDPATAGLALAATPGAEGAIFARASDQVLPAARALAPRLRETSAPRREGSPPGVSRPDASPSAGT